MYRLIDLFSGAGGFSLGFNKSVGFKPIWAIDNDRATVATYRANFGNHIAESDLEAWIEAKKAIPTADVVVGGPPCQGFSFLNRHRAGDARRTLWQPFLEVVELSQASLFIIENVQGLISSPEMTEITDRANHLGFKIDAKIINSADLGVPQVRRRCVIVGTLKSTPPFKFPISTHSRDGREPNTKPWTSVRSAIGDLVAPTGTDIREIAPPYDLHFGRNATALSQKRYRLIPSGGNRFDLQAAAPELTPPCWLNKPSGGTDLFGRLVWDQPSVTIRTEFWKPEKGRYLHPEEHRPITHREAARIMGFPDNFVFCGSKAEIARQIGNAVPPAVAASLATNVAQHLVETGCAESSLKNRKAA